jgi:predicted MPP superfamily phosphohydrolase
LKGWVLIPSVDIVVLIFCVLVQWRVTLLWLGQAQRLLDGGARLGAYAGILLFDAVFALGCAYNSQSVLGRLPMASPHAALLGAASLTFALLAASVLMIRAALHAAKKRLHAEFNPGRRRVLNTAAGALIAAPMVTLAYGFSVGRLDFHVRELDVPLPDLPAGLEGLRILHLSDIHLSAFLSERDLIRIIDASNGLRPHLVLMTGDLISRVGDPLDACIAQLARLKSDAGTFGCLGNHERFVGVEAYTQQAAARLGVEFLRHQAAPLRFGGAVLNLAGVDYQSLGDRQHYLRGADRLIAPGAFNVLLSHNPDVFPVAARQGYNLTLAGHTHGGQVSVEILDQSINPARFLTPYVYGLYRSGPAAEYVTRGIGTIGIPARIGAPPEISLLKLRKA